uniref:Uncharacterized protein n=1 Tax=Quercus lobata TaxID=97700 RepID=A0A7N2KW94_QUELO
MIKTVAALKSLKKHKRVCLYLLENPRKESVVSKLARGHVSKFILVGTVLDVEDANNAINAGAKFLMSPAMVKDLMQGSDIKQAGTTVTM